MADAFPHRPRLLRLNNGSYGAAPAAVLAEADDWRKRYTADPDSVVVVDVDG